MSPLCSSIHGENVDIWLADDKMHDECGVFGVFSPERDVARLAFFALYALQHRGQESAGIVSRPFGISAQGNGFGGSGV
jgi:glutamate synthase domain-containing protein 1